MPIGQREYTRKQPVAKRLAGPFALNMPKLHAVSSELDSKTVK